MQAQPSISNHLRQASRNQQLAQAWAFDRRSWEWRQWGVTAAFYAAVHLAKALALKSNEQRVRRESWHDFYSRVIRTLAPANASVSYERLRTAAVRTRYHLWMPPHRTAGKLVNQDLAAVDVGVRPLC